MFLPKFLGGGSRVSGKIARGGPHILRFIASFSKICLGGCCFIPPLPPYPPPPVCIYEVRLNLKKRKEGNLNYDWLIARTEYRSFKCFFERKIFFSFLNCRSIDAPGGVGGDGVKGDVEPPWQIFLKILYIK